MGKIFSKFVVEMRKGELIFCESEPGDVCYYLLSGLVRIARIRDNKERILGYVGIHEFFGEMAIINSARRGATAIAEEDSNMLRFNKNIFYQVIRMYPLLGIKLLYIVSKRIAEQSRKLNIVTLRNLQTRVMDVFMMTAEQMGVDLNSINSDLFLPFLAPEEIANWTNDPAEEVSKVLKQMESVGKIYPKGNSIGIKNILQFRRQVAAERQNILS